jgi:hypothetical protein
MNTKKYANRTENGEQAWPHGLLSMQTTTDHGRLTTDDPGTFPAFNAISRYLTLIGIFFPKKNRSVRFNCP